MLMRQADIDSFTHIACCCRVPCISHPDELMLSVAQLGSGLIERGFLLVDYDDFTKERDGH